MATKRARNAKRTTPKKSAKRTTRKAPRKRATAKRTPRKAPRKRAAAKRTPRGAPRKRATAKRTPRRAPRKRAAAKRAPRRAPRKRATAKRAVRRSSARPALKVVKRPAPGPAPRRAAPTPVPPAFAGATAGASAKDLVLFEMERAQTALAAAIKGMGEASANEPLGPGRWTPRQVLLHLVAWDRAALPALEVAYARNERPPLADDEVERVNAQSLAQYDHLGWEEARRLLQTARGELRAAFEAIPDEPAEVWSEQHAVGWMARFLAGHDRHHADQIKAARLAAAESPA